jgi:hypothetical protein
LLDFVREGKMWRERALKAVLVLVGIALFGYDLSIDDDSCGNGISPNTAMR